MQESNFLNTSLKYGAFAAISLLAVFVCLYLTNNNPLGASSWLGCWILPLFIVLAIKRFKYEQGGFITYGQAVKTGFWTSLGTALLFSGMVYIFGTIIDSGIVEMQKTETLEGIEKSRAFFSESFYEQSLKNIEMITLGTLTTSDFVMKVIGGLLFSLLAAAIIKNSTIKQTISDDDRGN